MVMVAERVIISKLLLFYKTLKDKNISSWINKILKLTIK
jgi:hypothetical protein